MLYISALLLIYLWFTLWLCQYLTHTTSNGRVHTLESILKETAMALFKHLSGESMKKHYNLTRTAIITANKWTVYLPIISSECLV
jgi:hypothetical protein